MSAPAAIENALLGRILPDRTTGLPSLAYFRLVRDWEERRARRTGTRVRVIKLSVTGATRRDLRMLPGQLCRELRDTDLIASDGPTRYRLLLTTPDAEKAPAIVQRLERLIESANRGRAVTDLPLAMDIRMEDERILSAEPNPCEPCDVDLLAESGDYPHFLPQA